MSGEEEGDDDEYTKLLIKSELDEQLRTVFEKMDEKNQELRKEMVAKIESQELSPELIDKLSSKDS